MSGKKTAIVTGASGGIGAGLVDVAAGYEKGDGKGYCRCRSLPGTGRSCERRDTPRGWCRSGSSLVAARQFNIVPAACPPVICEAVQADTRAQTNVGSNSGKGET